MKSSLFFLALVALVVEFQSVLAHEKFYNAINALHANMECFGDEFHGWVIQVENAMKTCNEKAMRGGGDDQRYADNRNADWDKVLSQFYTSDGNSNYRNKRAAKFTAEKVQKLKSKMAKKAEIFRCVMQEVKVTGRDNEVDPEALYKQYVALPRMTREVAEDIRDAIDTCKQASMCLPADRPGNPVPADIMRTKFFLYCERMYRYSGCLKKTVRPFVKSFDLSGLDGRLDHMESDEAKIAEIMYNSYKVGPDSYGLFE